MIADPVAETDAARLDREAAALVAEVVSKRSAALAEDAGKRIARVAGILVHGRPFAEVSGALDNAVFEIGRAMGERGIAEGMPRAEVEPLVQAVTNSFARHLRPFVTEPGGNA